MAVKAQPEGYHSLIPVVICKNAHDFVTFAEKVFGAKERLRMPMPDGTIAHAELVVGDSIMMVGEANDQWTATPTAVHVYVEDVDGVYQRALEAGSTAVSEPSDEFYGDRTGGFRDPFGNLWNIARHIEDVSEEEMERRMAEVMKEQ